MSKSPPNPVFTLKGSMQPIHSLIFCLNKNEELIYAGTQKGKVHLWDLKSNREIKCQEIGDETCLTLHKVNNNTIITQDKIGIYKMWEEDKPTKDWTLIRTFTSTYFGFCRSVIDEQNNFILCPGNDSAVKLFYLDNIHANEEIIFRNKKNINEKLGEVMVIKCFEKFVLIAYESGSIKIWSVKSRKCLTTACFLSNCPMALDINYCHNSSNCKLFGYVGTDSDEIKEFNILISDISSVVSIVKRRDIKITNPGVSCIAIRPDCKLFVAGCWDNRLRLFSCKSLKLLVVLDFHKEIIQDVLFSHKRVNSWSCQYLLASAGLDRRVSLWDLYN